MSEFLITIEEVTAYATYRVTADSETSARDIVARVHRPGGDITNTTLAQQGVISLDDAGRMVDAARSRVAYIEELCPECGRAVDDLSHDNDGTPVCADCCEECRPE